MTRKHLKGWRKHGDFIVFDILCLQLSFVLSYWLNHGFDNPYASFAYKFQDLVLIMCQLLVILFGNGYKGILRRKRFDEVVAVVRYIAEILLAAMAFLFLVHSSSVVSRLQYGTTAVFFIFLSFTVRSCHKRYLINNMSRRSKRSVVLVTSAGLVQEALDKLQPEGSYQDFFISSVILLDGEAGGNTETKEDLLKLQDENITVVPLNDAGMEKITRGWVDEVFILQPNNMPFPAALMEDLMTMGITVNYTSEAISDSRWPVTDIRKMGHYKVLTNSNRFATAGELTMKRIMDIAGGLAGTIITGILFLFLAPAIYRKSPGPIFFAQERVGRNGRKFKMYKFRSMYMDAEERKAALMAENKVQDGMMFKMDDDPRIIGSEKKGKDGKPKGIGNFIRNTSLDEFPQFINILLGQMSLVGTRPPTVDEWEKYSPAHRARMSFKPGLTGMWQVSGRSEITDFDEVVRLDCEYIDNWTIWLDIKILLKTAIVVFKRKGAA